MTRQKALILRLVRGTKEHPTADMVFEWAQAEMPGIVRATVYNNLNALVREGEIIRLHAADGADHFDGTVLPHAHLICNTCGCIHDADMPGDVISRFVTAHGVDPHTIHLSAQFVCDECREGVGA